MKILVVDDGQLAINSLVRILCRVAPDCDYISAMTTEDALTWMRQGPMDAAFLNLEMPGMNGFEASKIIKQTFPGLPVIIVTAHLGENVARRCLECGIDDYIIQPVHTKVLYEQLGKFLD